MTRLIGLDVGTTSLKGLVVAGDGRVIDRAEVSYPLDLPHPGLVRART